MRGSCPSASPATARYGGNTSSVLVEAAGRRPLLLDLGTGLASFGRRCPDTEPFEGAALVTHLHFDHVLGLPFFEPVNRSGARLEVFGPAQPDGSLADAFAALVRPPYFPLHLHQLQGDLDFVDVADERFPVGGFDVTARLVPHLGPTLGYRVESEGRALAYLSDHQAPAGHDGVADAVLELCDGADLVVHDAQYTRAELAAKPDWGHSSADYAVVVAREAGARRLCLFHHDPSHGDADLDEILAAVRPAAEAAGVDVLLAAEGLTLTL